MNIYEFSYAVAVICYRNIDALEERHSICGETDEELYTAIEAEFTRRFEMVIKVLSEGVSNSEKQDFLVHFIMCSRGFRQWNNPKIVPLVEEESLTDFVLKDVKKACLRNERLTEDMMKHLNRSVHDRVFTWLMNSK